MPAMTPWRNVDRTTWAIPEDLLPCSQFQLEWFLEWELYPDSSGGMTSHVGKWRWQALGAGDAMQFDSMVSIKGTAIWFPGGELISWYIQMNANNPVIATTVPVRPAILGVPSEADSWYQRADGTWGNEAEAGYIAEEGWVPGAGGMDFPVYATYQSAIYQVPLSAGTRLRVPFHSVGAFQLPKVANLRIRTLPAPAGFSLNAERVGILRAILPAGTPAANMTHSYSFDGGRSFVQRTIAGLYSPSQVKDAANSLWLCGKITEFGWVLRHSETDGLAWSTDMLIWEANYTDAKIIAGSDGTVVSIARDDNMLWCRTSLDGFCSTARVGPATNPMELTMDVRGQAIFASDGKQTTYQSLDCGRTWLLLAGSVT